MKAFVTGATGFIGASIVRELLNDSVQVRVLTRPGSDIRNLAGLDIEIWQGNLENSSSLATAVSGCDWVFHAAADYRLWTRTPETMYRTNVDGTKNLLEACLSADVKRVVYTSSVGCLGNPGDGTPGDEETPVSLDEMVGHYKKSKFLAEREAERFVDKGLPLVIVNPSTPVGPMDIKPTPTGKIIVDFLNGRMPAYLETGLNLIAVEDCARGHILAAEKGNIGRKYILGNRNMTLGEIFCTLELITGMPAPKLKLPYWPILTAAYINEWISGITGKEPLIPLAGVQMARKYMYFDSTRALRELGLPQTHLESALGRAVDWFIANGYVKNQQDT